MITILIKSSNKDWEDLFNKIETCGITYLSTDTGREKISILANSYKYHLYITDDVELSVLSKRNPHDLRQMIIKQLNNRKINDIPLIDLISDLTGIDLGELKYEEV